MKSFLQYLLYGGIVGVANIIPGLSGGTMAVVLGIYDHLIEAISNLRRRFLESVLFLVPIVLGAGLALLLTGKGIDYLLTHYAMVLNFFFIGVIVGSLPMLYRKARTGRQKGYHWVSFLLALLVMLLIGLFGGEKNTADAVVATVDATLLLTMFFGGIISAICMLIPGISGSFVMLLLGIYPVVIKAISDFNLLLLFAMGVGILVGLFLGATLIRFLMARFPEVTYCAIMGFVLGSVPVLFLSLYRGGTFTTAPATLIASLLALAIGLFVTIGFERIAKRFPS